MYNMYRDLNSDIYCMFCPSVLCFGYSVYKYNVIELDKK